MSDNSSEERYSELLERAKADLGIRGRVVRFGSSEGHLSPIPAGASQEAGEEFLRRGMTGDPEEPFDGAH